MIPAPLDEELRREPAEGEKLPSSSRTTRLTPGGVGLRVPGTLAYRHLAIRLVATACRAVLDGEWSDMASPDDAFTHEVVSAFGEAFNNIALHGYSVAAPGAIRVEVEWDEEKFVVLVIDRGRTFDMDNVSLPDLDAMQESGMGVFIMRTCMDEVHYQPGPPNVLRLVKLRRRGAAQDEGGRGAAGESAGGHGEEVEAVEQSAWRMKAIRGPRWGLDPEAAVEPGFTTEGTPVSLPQGMDERMAEGSRRR